MTKTKTFLALAAAASMGLLAACGTVAGAATGAAVGGGRQQHR
jgi:hypothetical protein